MPGQISQVDVQLTFSGGYNGDLYCYLTHGTGFSVLLNRVGQSAANPGGYGDTGFSMTLADAAANDIHNYQSVGYLLNGNGQLTGNWQPDGRATDPLTALDTDPRSAFLGSFNTLSADGQWTLFVADLSAGEQSTLVSWSLDIQAGAVPEAGTLLVSALAVWAGLGCGLLRSRFSPSR